MKQRQFEIPYNFNADFVDKMQPYIDLIDTVYIPMYYEDGLTTRNPLRADWYVTSRDEYVQHLNKLMQHGFRPNILIQDPVKEFDRATLQWYVDIGIKHFTVYQDAVAYLLRDIEPDVIISASITKKLTPVQIAQLPSGLYDNVILHFAYNHSLDIIKTLRTDLKYIIIVNAECHQDCYGTHHWYQTLQYDELSDTWSHLDTPRIFNNVCTVHYNESAMVYPEYLHHYDDYISVYKLIDRRFSTERILTSLRLFADTARCYSAPDSYLNRKNIQFFNKTKILPNERSS